MLDFIKYLKENFNDDFTSTEKIIKEKWDKVVEIIKEAFDDKFADKRTALYKIQNDFINEKIAPKTIDVDFLKNNMDYVVDKVNSLDEGEIRIIINNDVNKGSASTSTGCGCSSPVSVDTGDGIDGIDTIELESEDKMKKADKKDDKKGKKGKRGRPKKVVEEAEEAEEMEVSDEIEMNNEEEKIVQVKIDGTKVIVEPSENTGLQATEHEFETEEEATSFAETLKDLFQGFTVEIESPEAENSEEEPEEGSEDESEEEVKLVGKVTSESDDENETEEPEDSGEEMEDAGDEPEDSGEEPEDSISWEDVADIEGNDEEAAEEEMWQRENIDLNKLVGKLVKVKEGWYNVQSISENDEIVCLNKEGVESKFTLDQIDEMEYDVDDETEDEEKAEEEMEQEIEITDEADAEECMTKPAEEEMDVPEETEETEENVEEEMEEPESYEDEDGSKVFILKGVKFSDDIEETLKDAIAKGYEDFLHSTLGSNEGISDETKTKVFWGADVQDFIRDMGSEEEMEEISAEEVEEEMETAEEGISFSKMANRYLEEELYNPESMNGKGLTGKVSAPPKKVEKIPAAPKSMKKNAPSAALTAKPSKVKEKIEPVGKVPKSDKKAAPKATLTAKPMKISGKVEKVKAPEIPSEYKGGKGPKIKS